MLRSIPSTIQQAWKDFGFGEGSLFLASRILELATRGRCRLIRYHLVAQPIPHPPRATCPPSANDVVTDAYADAPQRTEFPRHPAVIAQRFTQRHTCLMVLSKGRFAGFMWLARGEYEEDEVRCRFVLASPHETVWDYDVYVAPAFRLGRTFARLWDAANARLAEEGISWSISRISAFNLQSVRSHQRLGLVRLHAVTFLCLGPLQVSLLPGKPYLHICTRHETRPTITLKQPLAARHRPDRGHL